MSLRCSRPRVKPKSPNFSVKRCWPLLMHSRLEVKIPLELLLAGPSSRSNNLSHCCSNGLSLSSLLRGESLVLVERNRWEGPPTFAHLDRTSAHRRREQLSQASSTSGRSARSTPTTAATPTSSLVATTTVIRLLRVADDSETTRWKNVFFWLHFLGPSNGSGTCGSAMIFCPFRRETWPFCVLDFPNQVVVTTG